MGFSTLTRGMSKVSINDFVCMYMLFIISDNNFSLLSEKNHHFLGYN